MTLKIVPLLLPSSTFNVMYPYNVVHLDSGPTIIAGFLRIDWLDGGRWLGAKRLAHSNFALWREWLFLSSLVAIWARVCEFVGVFCVFSSPIFYTFLQSTIAKVFDFENVFLLSTCTGIWSSFIICYTIRSRSGGKWQQYWYWYSFCIETNFYIYRLHFGYPFNWGDNGTSLSIFEWSHYIEIY